MTTAWGQLEQLLTCAICLDRFRNPKLLPCNHTFCAEPCMDGLVDYARRQIKCPECRAEHRIPYNGIQTFPNNVTLSRFLDLHRNITGEEPEPVPSMMERCGICGEKSMVVKCAHCEKKVCDECKEAHLDILRREISRINAQVKKGVVKLNESLQQTQRNSEKLQQTHTQMKEEISEIVRRFIKDLKDKEEKLLQELDEYTQEETRKLVKLKDDLEVESVNLSSNCELADLHINENEEWTGDELVEYKEIFNKSLDFLRNFDPDMSDTRKVKLQLNSEIDILRRSISDFAELKITNPPSMINNPLSPSSSSTNLNSTLSVPLSSQNALMRSRSDHTLAMQFQQRLRQNDPNARYTDYSRLSDSERESRTDRASSPTRRAYGSRLAEEREATRNRYLRTADVDSYSPRNYGRSTAADDDSTTTSTTSHYRSRFMRERERNSGLGDYNADESHDSDYGGRSVRFEEAQSAQPKAKVFENESAIKGPLSGVAKLTDSPFVMQRLHQNEVKQKIKEEEARDAPVPAPVVQSTPAPVSYQPRTPQRQISEDEIEKQKKQNKIAAAAAAETTPAAPAQVPQSPGTKVPESPSRLVTKRVSSLQRDERSTPPYGNENSTRRGSQENTIVEDSTPSVENNDSTRVRRQRGVASEDCDVRSPPSRQSSSSTPRSVRSPVGENTSLNVENVNSDSTSSTKSSTQTSKTTSKSNTTAGTLEKKDNRSSSRTTVSESDSEESSSETESDSDTATAGAGNSVGKAASNKYEKSVKYPSSVSTLLNRSAATRKESVENRYSAGSGKDSYSPSVSMGGSKAPFTRASTLTEEPSYRRKSITEYPSGRNTFDSSSSTYQARGNLTRAATYDEDPIPTRHVEFSSSSSTPYSSRFLSNSRPAAIAREEYYDSGRTNKYGSRGSRENPSSGSSSYKSRLAKSKSSHTIGVEDSDEETPLSPSYRSRFSDTSSFTPRTSRSGYVYRTRESSPPEEKNEDTQFGVGGGNSSGSWAAYLRNKYGNKSAGTGSSSSTGTKEAPEKMVLKSRSSHAVYGRSLSESSDEETPHPLLLRGGSKDAEPMTPKSTSAAYSSASMGSSFSKSMYMQKKKMMMRIGSRGTEVGSFTWPRCVTCGPDNSIIVADSSNHRVQVFDSTGRFQFEFGSYGSNEGEFDCLAGVAVNRIGQIMVSDRYNHRIQVFDPTGRFLRTFGSEGRGDGKFSYPWGVATDALGFIYVCDKENHRVQVFQSDGTFVGKFGSIGSRTGQLEHPHYIAVTNTNRVVVTDTNNHRIQIFDVNGRSLTTFGTEGSNDGQFKFPRGLAVDDQGFIIVGDSGNNRIQIFAPDGTFIKSFGTWGAGDGEFKGIEGVAVSSTGNILVCDRENHRVQIF